MDPSNSSAEASVPSISETEDNLTFFVKLLSGETISLNLPPSTPLATLRQLLSLRTSLSISSFRITYGGRPLITPASAPDPTLSSLNIASESTLELAAPARRMPPKKVRCTFKDCRDPAQRIVGDCSFCSGHYCGRHRMLEDHRCSGLENCKKESHERNADKLISERTLIVRGI